MKISKRLITELKNKEYRDAFVSAHIDTGIPFQVRALREHRGLTQKELAERAGMKQERISAIENPNYKNAFTLATLKRLAYAFDIALIVRFAPISQLVDWELKLSSEALEAVSFDEDPYFQPPVTNIVGQVGIVIRGEGIVNFINPSRQVPKTEIPYLPDRIQKSKLRQESQQEPESQFQEAMRGAMR
jgi:transcriptional regulator with XRE-family HTH domain